MASAADRFSRLEKLAIFLIALGQERTREILADVDVDTLQHLNGAMAGLGDISAAEKAAVMLEFAHFFFEDRPLAPDQPVAPDQAAPDAAPSLGATPTPKAPKPKRRPARDATLDLSTPQPDLSNEEQAILHTLDKLRRKVDPGQIDWGKAGYDFGDGFKGSSSDRG